MHSPHAPRPGIQLVALLGFLLVFPFFLKRRPRVVRQVTICAPPEAIFPLLDDLRNWPRWATWSDREEVRFNYGETAVGEGASQEWQSARGSGRLVITRSEPSARMECEFTMNNGVPIFARFDLVRDGACTRVTWKCVWDAAANPYRRYFDLAHRWLLGRDFAAGLANLKTMAERSQPS